MGALAGNPMLGDAHRVRPTAARRTADRSERPDVAGPAVCRAASGTTNHRTRNGVLAGAAALVVLARRRGHRARGLEQRLGQPVGLPPSGSGRIPSGTPGSGSQSPLGNSFGQRQRFGSGNGSPFGGGWNSGNIGQHRRGSSGSSNSSGPSDVSAIASKVDPGLVDINTTLGYQQEQAAGTGIVLSSNGVVLTNNHVIDGATSISVTDVGNQKTYTASVVGYDRTQDIAVLQLHNASGLQTATLGNSSNASVGEHVVGIGNAGGTGGTPSAAGGTVTALNQSITASDDGDGTSEQLSGLIQTNADIQPGDSGGALVNTSGDVLGVDTAASAGFSFQTNGPVSGNQGFAIPINTALSIARTIEAGTRLVDGPHRRDRLPRRRDQPQHLEQLRVSRQFGEQRESGGGFGGGFGNGQFAATRATPGPPRPRVTSGASVAGVVTNGPAQEAGLAAGRRDHLDRRQDHQLVQRPHQRHGDLPPGRQGDRRLDRRQRARPTPPRSSCPRGRRSRRVLVENPRQGGGRRRHVALMASALAVTGKTTGRSRRAWPGPPRSARRSDPTHADTGARGCGDQRDLLHDPEHVVDGEHHGRRGDEHGQDRRGTDHRSSTPTRRRPAGRSHR